MNELNNKVKVFVNGLLLHPLVQKLKLVDDKGINVSTHTYDVLRLAVKKLKSDFGDDMEDISDKIKLFDIMVGVIIHDTTKGTLRLNNHDMSHSFIMKNNPEFASEEARKILRDVEVFTNLKIKESVEKGIIHIVASHHGRWGKVKPETREAVIVHEADKYSAMYHRISPISAKKIVKLMSEGFNKDEICKITGFTEGIIEDRLKRAKKELNVKTNRELINYYLKRGYIPEGDEFFARRIVETEKLIKKVENIGFEELILKNPLIDYIYDDDVFI